MDLPSEGTDIHDRSGSTGGSSRRTALRMARCGASRIMTGQRSTG
jgi:hypothetical protein